MNSDLSQEIGLPGNSRQSLQEIKESRIERFVSFDIAEASLKIQSLDILVIEGIPEITLEYLSS